MTTFPKAPMVRAPAAIADNGRQATRAHARLDSVESVQSKQSADISTAQTDTNANTTAIAAINTGTGGTTHENFLGTISKASHVNETNSGGWTTGGALNGGASQFWDNTHAAALVPWMNQVNADIGNIISALQAAGLMS